MLPWQPLDIRWPAETSPAHSNSQPRSPIALWENAAQWLGLFISQPGWKWVQRFSQHSVLFLFPARSPHSVILFSSSSDLQFGGTPAKKWVTCSDPSKRLLCTLCHLYNCKCCVCFLMCIRPELQWSHVVEKKPTGGSGWQSKAMCTSTNWTHTTHPMAPAPMPVPQMVNKSWRGHPFGERSPAHSSFSLWCDSCWLDWQFIRPSLINELDMWHLCHLVLSRSGNVLICVC